MLNITFTNEARKALHSFLDKEGGAACFRLREFVSGCVSCRNDVRRILRVTLDAPEENDVTAEAGGMPFVMEALLLANYGNSFFISLDRNNMPAVTALRALFH
ncbi:MAG: hypothetical protein LBC94_08265 [Desulfovibrio sp.]|jgi:hypothetical protein|nr:hypothetical protein [Desulfovibrio sp.]